MSTNNDKQTTWVHVFGGNPLVHISEPKSGDQPNIEFEELFAKAMKGELPEEKTEEKGRKIKVHRRRAFVSMKAHNNLMRLKNKEEIARKAAEEEKQAAGQAAKERSTERMEIVDRFVTKSLAKEMETGLAAAFRSAGSQPSDVVDLSQFLAASYMDRPFEFGQSLDVKLDEDQRVLCASISKEMRKAFTNSANTVRGRLASSRNEEFHEDIRDELEALNEKGARFSEYSTIALYIASKMEGPVAKKCAETLMKMTLFKTQKVEEVLDLNPEDIVSREMEENHAAIWLAMGQNQSKKENPAGRMLFGGLKFTPIFDLTDEVEEEKPQTATTEGEKFTPSEIVRGMKEARAEDGEGGESKKSLLRRTASSVGRVIGASAGLAGAAIAGPGPSILGFFRKAAELTERMLLRPECRRLSGNGPTYTAG